MVRQHFCMEPSPCTPQLFSQMQLNNLPYPRPVKIGNLVNSCIYFAHQTHEIYQVLPYSVQFKAPGISQIQGSFEIHWVRQYLVNIDLFGIKDL